MLWYPPLSLEVMFKSYNPFTMFGKLMNPFVALFVWLNVELNKVINLISDDFIGNFTADDGTLYVQDLVAGEYRITIVDNLAKPVGIIVMSLVM